MSIDRVFLHLDDHRRRVVDPFDVYFLEADGGDTLVRLRGRRRKRDVRPLGEIERVFAPHGFVRVHSNHIVNARRILELRRRDEGRDWEVRLEPPVNVVLPVSRSKLRRLRELFGEGD